jgi:hypothetical protein
MLEKPAGLYSRFYTEILRFGSCFGSSLDLLELGFLRASLTDRQTDRQTKGLEIRLWFWRFHPQRLDDCFRLESFFHTSKSEAIAELDTLSRMISVGVSRKP